MSIKKIQILTPIVTSVNGEVGEVTVDMKKLGIEDALAKKSDVDHTHNYAGSDWPGGPATSAKELTTDAGAYNKPVYFKSGVPVASLYTIDKSVPANAVFTDTTYDIGNSITAGVSKLYDRVGTNLDGAMTQQATRALFDGKATISKTVPVTLLASGWIGSSAPYTYNLAVDGVTAFSNQEIIPATNITRDQLINLQGTNMIDGGQSDGKIILKATKNKPTVDIPMRVILRGDAAILNKGDLITMDLGNGSKQYRVLKMNGSVAEVLAMYEYNTSTKFNTNYSNIYMDGELDVALNNTFYNTLSATAKSAIVEKNIIQYAYSGTSSVYNATTHASYANYSTKELVTTVGNRKVYALDVEDIEQYFGGTGGSVDDKTTGVFSTVDIWTFFWNQSSKISVYPWLRSADANDSKRAYSVLGTNGYLASDGISLDGAVRPAFQIDLSKIPFTKV